MKYKLEKPVNGTIGAVKYQCSIEWRNGKFVADEPESSGLFHDTWETQKEIDYKNDAITVDGASAELIREQVEKCPSGALAFHYNNAPRT